MNAITGALRLATGEGHSPEIWQLSVYPKGAVISLDAQSLWLVEQGVVKLTSLDIEGTERIVGIAAPGMVFGEGLSFLEAYQATALGEVKLSRILLADLEASAELAQALLPCLMQRIQQTESLLVVAGHQTVEVRLKQLLLLLAQVVGQPLPGATQIGIRLTHEELGSMIRASRVTVTRLLGQFKQQGWVAVDHKHRLIVNQVVLVQLEDEFGVFKLGPLHSRHGN